MRQQATGNRQEKEKHQGAEKPRDESDHREEGNRQQATGSGKPGEEGMLLVPPQPGEDRGQGPGAGDRKTDPKTPTPDPRAPCTVTIELPVARIVPGAYLSDHVEARLTSDQAKALREVQNALDRTAARLANGRVVQNGADAVRWMLEQVAKANAEGGMRNAE